MSNGKNAAATKEDIRMVMEKLGKMFDAQEQWKDEMKQDMKVWKMEITDHFDVVAENIRHDFVSANREEIEVLKDGHTTHEQQILTLERATGLAA